VGQLHRFSPLLQTPSPHASQIAALIGPRWHVPSPSSVAVDTVVRPIQQCIPKELSFKSNADPSGTQVASFIFRVLSKMQLPPGTSFGSPQQMRTLGNASDWQLASRASGAESAVLESAKAIPSCISCVSAWSSISPSRRSGDKRSGTSSIVASNCHASTAERSVEPAPASPTNGGDRFAAQAEMSRVPSTNIQAQCFTSIL